MIIGKVIKNKVVLYMATRYVTYALQFAASLIIALKLGPDMFGVWSFLLLLVNFFNIFDFGISNSINVLLVQDRDNQDLANMHIKSAVALTIVMCVAVALIYLSNLILKPDIVVKYDAQRYLPIVFGVVVLAYFNKVFAAIYRVNNRLLEISIFQSIVPVSLFIAIVFFEGNVLYLILSYLIGNAIAILIFLFNKKIYFKGKLCKKDISVVAGKGFWLFLYNSAFYFILYLSSLLVSLYYPRAEYGKYNFAYTISHAVILLIDAFGYIIFPKMIMMLKEKDRQVNATAIDKIRGDYMTLVYLLILTVVPIICIAIQYIPKYADTGKVISLAALTLLPYANCFGINTFLIAQNRERLLSFVSMGCLVFNISIAFFCIRVLNISYEFVYMPILISYIIYTFLCSMIVSRMLSKNIGFFKVLLYAFPVKTMIPFFAFFTLVYCNHYSDVLEIIPILLFILCNFKGLRQLYNSIKSIIFKPEIVDL